MSGFAVSFYDESRSEHIWLERADIGTARECAMIQAEDSNRRQITIWQAVERIAPVLVSVFPAESSEGVSRMTRQAAPATDTPSLPNPSNTLTGE